MAADMACMHASLLLVWPQVEAPWRRRTIQRVDKYMGKQRMPHLLLTFTSYYTGGWVSGWLATPCPVPAWAASAPASHTHYLQSHPLLI